MLEPKKDIYTILSGVGTAYQNRPQLIKEIPCLYYYVSSNVPVYVLEQNIGYQEIEVVVDILANTSSESGTLLSSLESAMLSEGYRLTYCADIPDDNYSHITTKFNLVGY